MTAPLPHFRHQSSLEGLIDFSSRPSLTDEQSTWARRKFYVIINHFQAVKINKDPYDRLLLIRYTYEYALSEESKDMFLQAFFQCMALSVDEEGSLETLDFNDSEEEEKLRSTLFDFADYLMDNFFLPLKASTKKTPQPSPIFRSPIQDAQGGNRLLIGTSDRISSLRGDCLVRDRYRCVITRKFHSTEAVERMKRSGGDARDDDGNVLPADMSQYEWLEVAHILPHSLTETERGSSQLNPQKEAALSILNMFDHGVVDLINGSDIDRPQNAITLTTTYHRYFGDFDIYFTPVTSGEPPHTYRIDSFLPSIFTQSTLPITRTLYLTDDRTIEPPSSRLLAVHRAIAHILHLSAAGEYIDKLLRDMEKRGVEEDGSTELDRFVALRLGGWVDGAVDSY